MKQIIEKISKFFKKEISCFRFLILFIMYVSVGPFCMWIGSYFQDDDKTFYILIIGFSLLIIGLLVIFVGKFGKSGKGYSHNDNIKPLLNSITSEFVKNINMPVAICNSNGTIVWSNAAFDHLYTDIPSVHGNGFEKISGFTLEDVCVEGGQTCTIGGRRYNVSGYNLKTGNKTYYMTLWQDISENARLSARLKNEDTKIAYIMVDNFEEMIQYSRESYKTASSKIEHVLSEWALSSGGILKEYEREKFIFIFPHESITIFKENKFEVLDKIRNIHVGENLLPLTVSIGIGDVDGTFADKERAASNALEMALQRGGDQAVVKSDDGMDFYGGKSKTVQKRTRVRARVVANDIALKMSASKNVLIMGHRNPDFDSIGACVGMARMAKLCGVDCKIIAPDNNPNWDKCKIMLGGIPEYESGKIFIAPSEAQEMVSNETLLIIVDVNAASQFESKEIADIVPNVIFIDHHRKTAEFPRDPVLSYIEPSASSCCELVSELLEHSLPDGMLNPGESNLLYAGIVLDTKQFTRNTGVRTFSSVLYLRAQGASPSEVQNIFRTSLDELVGEAGFESNVAIYKKIFAISVDNGKHISNESKGSRRVSAAKAADKLLSLEGIEASFTICSIDDSIHISARSCGNVNVQLILGKIGGGGHYDAAATQIKNGSMADAITKLKYAIDDYLVS